MVGALAIAVLAATLDYGPHAAGHQSLLRHDASRTFGREPRPVQIELWYPAAKRGGRALTLRDYGAPADLPALPMRARRDAPFARGTFPLVVYAHTETHRKAFIAEYLASHGYIVAAPAVLGTFDRDLDPSMLDIETQARDVELTIGIASGLAAVDSSRVAVAGMSFGALSALLTAMRNANVDAVISLDGGIGSTPNVENFGFDRSPSHDRTRLRVPLLHVYGANVPGTQLDYLRGLVHAERRLVPFDALSHQDFGGAAMLADDPAKHAAFAAVLQTVRTFLDRTLRGSADALADRGEILPALAAPPMFEELRQVVRSRGAKALRDRRQPWPLDLLRKTANWLSDHGRTADARDVLEIAVESHPQSARAHYGLGLALAALGERDAAAERFRRTLELAPNDPLLDDAARKRLIDAATQRLGGQ